MDDIITLDYGSGGVKTSQLIEEIFVPAFANAALEELSDAAAIESTGTLAFSTDSFVVDPIFFPGGDIGKLSVCGTVNDIAVCGAEPRYLSCSFIIEEGLELSALEKIVQSIRRQCDRAGVQVVTGDTKVVEKGRGDRIYINTAGIGIMKHPGLGCDKIQSGDAVLVSGTVGDHGTAVMLARNGLLQGDIKSDCAALNGLTEALLSGCPGVRVLRDPTRGGLATTLNEFIEGTALGIELEEDSVPVRDDVRAACDMLGLEPMYCANEGKIIAVVAPEQAERALEAMRSLPEGENAAIIGRVSEKYPGKLVVKTRLGGSRIMQKLTGAQLPRIC